MSLLILCSRLLSSIVGPAKVHRTLFYQDVCFLYYLYKQRLSSMLFHLQRYRFAREFILLDLNYCQNCFNDSFLTQFSVFERFLNIHNNISYEALFLDMLSYNKGDIKQTILETKILQYFQGMEGIPSRQNTKFYHKVYMRYLGMRNLFTTMFTFEERQYSLPNLGVIVSFRVSKNCWQLIVAHRTEIKGKNGTLLLHLLG